MNVLFIFGLKLPGVVLLKLLSIPRKTLILPHFKPYLVVCVACFFLLSDLYVLHLSFLQPTTDLLSFDNKYKMAAAAIMNCYLVTLDHSLTKSTSRPEVCVKISCQSHYYFQSYGHLKILQIWLKTPIPAPKKLRFGGILTPKH